MYRDRLLYRHVHAARGSDHDSDYGDHYRPAHLWRVLRKAILRNVGALLGGALSLLAIIIATPNFDTLPAYMLVVFVGLLISAYPALSSGRIAYAGKQIGTTFMLVFAGLGPSPEIYSPLWRTWGVLLGTVVVAIVFSYYGQSTRATHCCRDCAR